MRKARPDVWSYEGGHRPPLAIGRFLLRTVAHFGVVLGLMAMSIVAGVAGFMHYERLEWRDAFMQTSMLLGGMGPTEVPQSPGGKIFASLFALYAGLVFIVAGAILLSPVLHRMLHLFHWGRTARADVE